MIDQAEIATFVSFLEGPTADADGNVYFTETRSQRIMRLSVGGDLSVFRENSNAANGLIFDSEFRLIACEGNNANPKVTRSNLKTGRVEVLAQNGPNLKMTAPNDVTLDAVGRIYFTDLPGGSIYRIDRNGAITQILNRP
ncbi:MAG: SMP-30/gluconolactonase/LRE family protein, partial [Acidobacteriia bacterium]|nr:SMP-30/gluconolactonase/LRE family protein [Terriglobia bacterium]